MRIRAIMFAFVAVLVLSLVGPGAVVAQDATPAAEIDFEITTLADAQPTDIPAGPAFLGLVRFSFPPGAATPAGADPGSVLVVVESGEFVAEIEDSATIRQAPREEPAASPQTGVFLQPGDTVYIPAGTSSTFRNAGQEDASLLAVLLFPEDPFGPTVTSSIADVGVELLASGMIEDIPSPAEIVLARATLGPNSELPASESPGPVLALLTEGELAYTVTSGESAVSDAVAMATGERPSARPAAEGADTEIASGAAILQQMGTVSGLRNDGADAAELLVAFIMPAEGALAATPAA